MEHFGIISIIPPILAIALAVKSKNVNLSLLIAVTFGAIALNNWNPIKGIVSIIPDYIYANASSNTQALINLFIIGGFVSVIMASGGTTAFAKMASKLIGTNKKAQIAMWLGGLFVWFSDSANSLIVGPIFQPLGDKFKVSREKFAYILDATSSPICALVPIISWGVYLMGLIDTELALFPQITSTSWEIFVEAVPFNFYSIMTLAMVGYIAFTGFDFGPMLKAERRTQSGKLLNDGATPMRQVKEVILPEGKEPLASTVIAPLITMLVVMFAILFANGFPKVSVSGTVIRQAIAVGFIFGAIVSIAIAVSNKLLTFKEAERAIFDGMKDMVGVAVMMILSWSIGSICKGLGTAYYILEVTENILNPALLPVILFIIGCLMSLATGSSWGTYAVLIPIGAPIALTMGSPFAVVVAAIISGGLFGDHCSPVSDTTLLASMGAACDHIDHVKTQFPYAITVAGVSMIMFTIAGFIEISWIVIPGLILLFAVIFAMHKVSVNRLKKPIKSAAKL